MSNTPPIPKLRKLLFKFYQENDPVILQQGFDLNGLVQYTSQKGIDVLNKMLQGRYGKVIDPDENTGTAVESFNRMSMGMAQSTFIVSKEQEFRAKLREFFAAKDPSMITPARADGFNKLVKFAMLNGVEKLNEKLKARYQEGIPSDTGENIKQEELDVTNAAFGNNKLNPFQLDVERLREDLKLFFTAVEDVEQLEVLDQQTDFACEVGMDEFNRIQEQYYGVTLNGFLRDEGRRTHENHKAEASPVQANRPVPPVDEIPVVQEYDTVEEFEEVELPEPDFHEMSDEEIFEELEAFYQRHDPENKGKLPQVVELAKSLGRKALNEKLVEIYDEPLPPRRRVERRVVQRKIPRSPQRPPAPVNPPREPVRTKPAPVQPVAEDQPPPVPHHAGPPPIRQIPKFNQGPINNKPQDEVIRENAWKPPAKEDPKIPEFLRIRNGMKQRIDGGKARVRDAQGNVMEINILIDVCKKYELDVMTGICKHCGFAKNDHWAVKTFR